MDWTIDASEWGIYEIEYTAEDGYGDKTVLSHYYIVDEAPQFTSVPDTVAYENQTYIYTVTATDADTIFGDSIAYSHAWSKIPSWLTLTDNGDGTATLSGTPSSAEIGLDTVRVEVHDRTTHYMHNHCSWRFQDFIIEVKPCSLAISAIVTDEPCPNTNAGSIDLTLGNATGTVTYTWSNNSSTQDIANLAPGTYFVEITDSLGCTAADTFAISAGVDNTAPSVITKNITVELDANGAATITAAQINDGSSDACGIDTIICTRSGSGGQGSLVNLAKGILSSGSTHVEYVLGGGSATNYRSSLGTACNENWYPNGTFCDEGSTENSTDSSYRVNTNAGVTWRNYNPGSDYGIMVTDFGATTDINAMSVFQMFSDGKTTHIKAFYHSSNSSTAPAYNDGDWVEFVPKTAVGSGTLSGSYVYNPLKLTFDNVNARYLKFYAYNDGSFGSSSWIEIRSIKMFSTSVPCDFSCEDVGVQNVYLTVVDNNGNMDTETATVTVEDNVNPVAATQNITIQLNANGAAAITAPQINDGSSDACGIDTVYLNNYDFACSNVGTNTVTLTVVDNNGNTDTETATVTVVDTVAPVATTQNLTVYLDANGAATITAAQINDGSSDACGIDTVYLNNYDFACSNVGTNIVTLTVVDNNGNTDTETATVTVVDTVAPVAVAQNVIVYLDSNGTGSISASQVDNGSSDACGIDSSYLDYTDYSCSDVLPSLSNVYTAAGRTVTYNSVKINGETTRILDVTGGSTVSLTLNWTNAYTSSYCPGCIQQYYLGLSGDGANETCLRSGGTNYTFTQNNTISFTAPTTPGIYAVSMGSSLQYSCVTSNLGARDLCASNNGIVALITVGKPNLANTLTVVDNNGNSNSTNFVVSVKDTIAPNAIAQNLTVTVVDTVAPVATTQNLTVYLDANGAASITAAQINDGSSDACGVDCLSK